MAIIITGSGSGSSGGSGGITTLNTLTGDTQTFAAVGTSGTAPAISSSGTAHTLNIPMASASSVTAGLISKTTYDLIANAAPLASPAFTTKIGLQELEIRRNNSTDFRFYVSNDEVFAVFPANNRMLVQGGTTSGQLIAGAGLSFFNSPGGTGITWVSSYNSNGVNTLCLAADNATVGLYITGAVTAIPLKIVYNISTAAESQVCTLLNGPAATGGGNPTKWFRFNDGSHDFVIPGWQV